MVLPWTKVKEMGKFAFLISSPQYFSSFSSPVIAEAQEPSPVLV